MDEVKIKELLNEADSSDEEIRRMITALRNLKTFTEHSCNGKSTKDVDLHWDSWDRNVNGNPIRNGSSSPRVHRYRSSKASDNEESLKCSPISPPQSSSSNCPFSPSFGAEDGTSFPLEYHRGREKSSSPPATPSAKKTTGRPPTTPPPARKHQTLIAEPFPLTKSKSHEEHLSNRIQSLDPTRFV